MSKNNRNIIECCNKTHQGAPRTGTQTSACASDLFDASRVLALLLGYIYRNVVQFHRVARSVIIKLVEPSGRQYSPTALKSSVLVGGLY